MGGEPPQTSPPPPPPAPGASREEWRQWRRQGRHSYWGGGHWPWFAGVVLVLVGSYSLLRSLGLLQWVRADVLWPLLVIALGLWLIIERAIPRRPPR